MSDEQTLMYATLEALEQRRSVRSFRPEPIPRATVEILLRAAVLAPTARHLEPWAFVVVQDRALLRRISDRAKSLWPPESVADHERHALAHMPLGNHFMEFLRPVEFNVFFDSGTLIVICARPVGPFAEADCWLAAENLMLAAGALGLGTCCIGSAVEALNMADIKQELAIPPDVAAVAPVIVGVPSHIPEPPGRRPPVVLSWKEEPPQRG